MLSFDIENSLKGITVGIDEAGRGPLCGPVYAACVLLNKNKFPDNINDSKKITENKREKIFEEIIEFSNNKLLFYGVGFVEANIIDQINIRNATKLAMKLAYEDFIKKYNNIINIDNIIVDGNFVPDIKNNIKNLIAIVKGDQKSYSIACASIIAKVLRDKELRKMGLLYPQYNWIKNKGYGTKQHIEAIKKYGLVDNYHRKSFCCGFITTISQSTSFSNTQQKVFQQDDKLK